MEKRRWLVNVFVSEPSRSSEIVHSQFAGARAGCQSMQGPGLYVGGRRHAIRRLLPPAAVTALPSALAVTALTDGTETARRCRQACLL